LSYILLFVIYPSERGKMVHDKMARGKMEHGKPARGSSSVQAIFFFPLP